MKKCSICKLDKEENEYHKNSSKIDGLDHRCKSCRHEYIILNRPMLKIKHHEHYLKNKDRINKKNKEWAKLNPDKSRNQKLMYAYGITLEQRNQMIKDQNGLCLICNDKLDETISKNIHVDHDHSTGKVRGILCKQCNSLIGLSREREDILLNSINYLRRYK